MAGENGGSGAKSLGRFSRTTKTNAEVHEELCSSGHVFRVLGNSSFEGRDGKRERKKGNRGVFWRWQENWTAREMSRAEVSPGLAAGKGEKKGHLVVFSSPV